MAKKRKRPQRPPPKGDLWQEPSSKRWVRHVINEMVPKMADSQFVISLVPDDRDGDVKYWVELGASICFNKPIIAVVFNDGPLPPKLELVADEVVRIPEGVSPDASEDLAAALTRVVERYAA